MRKSMVFLAGCAISATLLLGACAPAPWQRENNTYPQNAYFGNLFGMIYQSYRNDSIMNAWYAQYDKKMKLQEQKEQEKATLMEELLAGIAQEKSNLVGNKVPFETKEGLWYEVTDVVISEVSDQGVVLLECTLKIKDEATAKRMNNTYVVNVDYLDSKGEMVKKGGAFIGKFTGDKSYDSEESVNIQLWVPSAFANVMFDFAKLSFNK